MESGTSLYRLEKLMGARMRREFPLAPLTSLRVGGRAELFMEANNSDEILEIKRYTRENKMALRVLGKGTNLVIADGLLKGIVMQLKGTFAEITRKANRITIGGGCPLSLLIREAIKGPWQGTHVLVGIPGTLGGGVVMNAGTQLGSLGDLVEEVDILTNKDQIEKRTKKEMRFSYRNCALHDQEIVLRATIAFTCPQKAKDVKAVIREYFEKRRQTQPLTEKSAGCVFKNPENGSAGRFIEEAGLKGIKYGGIEVSRLHANFFINRGGGSFSDFMHLMEIVQTKVYRMFRVDLKPEVKIWAN